MVANYNYYSNEVEEKLRGPAGLFIDQFTDSLLMPEMHRRNTITLITFTLVFHTLRVLAVENVNVIHPL